jgi:hypothetical protein
MNGPIGPISLTLREEEERQRVLATSPRAKLPLMCRVYRDPKGQPLKHPLTNKFPQLSRRQRRELMRQAIKAQKKTEKSRCAQ